MTLKFYSYLSIFMIFFGILFFFIKQEIVVFRTSFTSKDEKISQQKILNKKKIIKINYWLNDRWNIEKTEILWTDNISENAFKIINNWLTLLNDEKILDKKASLQTVIPHNNFQEVYVSFDRPLFNDDYSTFEKLMLIESLLKTLRENDISFKKITFLTYHQEMIDNHLDFSHSWPIEGFVKL